MVYIECPRPALDKLEQSGLAERLLKSTDNWWRVARCSKLSYEGEVSEVAARVTEFFAQQGIVGGDQRLVLYSGLDRLMKTVYADEYGDAKDDAPAATPMEPAA